jgi:hypothetical protein
LSAAIAGQPYTPFDNAITEGWCGLRERAAVNKKCLLDSQSHSIFVISLNVPGA